MDRDDVHEERGAACLDEVVVMMEGSRKAGGGAEGAEGAEEVAGLDASRTQEGAEEQAARSCPWIKCVSRPSNPAVRSSSRSWIAAAICHDFDWISHAPQRTQSTK